jgi:hypothetical protein
MGSGLGLFVITVCDRSAGDVNEERVGEPRAGE